MISVMKSTNLPRFNASAWLDVGQRWRWRPVRVHVVMLKMMEDQRLTLLPTSGQVSSLAKALLGQPYEPRQTSGTAADVYKKFDINAEAVVRAAYETLAEVGAL